jgi:hypothetical protein
VPGRMRRLPGLPRPWRRRLLPGRISPRYLPRRALRRQRRRCCR